MQVSKMELPLRNKTHSDKALDGNNRDDNDYEDYLLEERMKNQQELQLLSQEY